MRVIYRKSCGGQSKRVWLYFRFWNHAFYFGEADAYPNGKYRLEIFAKSGYTTKHGWPRKIVWFRFTKYKKSTKEEIDRGLTPGYEFDPIVEKIINVIQERGE